MLLEDYIKQEIKKPFIWGETDCCATAIRWARIHSGMKVEHEFYSSKEEAEELLKDGFIKVLSGVFYEFLSCKPNKIKKGDVGIIILNDREGALGIKTATGWFTRNENGLMVLPNEVGIAKAWNICPV